MATQHQHAAVGEQQGVMPFSRCRERSGRAALGCRGIEDLHAIVGARIVEVAGAVGLGLRAPPASGEQHLAIEQAGRAVIAAVGLEPRR